MSAPLLEGLDSSISDEVPANVKNLPHVDFTPKNDGIFG